MTLNVTEFWKITLMCVPEIIKIFEFTTIMTGFMETDPNHTLEVTR